jgi:tRNA dimethylallyltransferase
MSKSRTPKGQGPDYPVALIAGPTASGKSAIALQLADTIKKAGQKALIVNADSMQVYSDIPILSAAPSKKERSAHPHSLYLEWDGATACSAADWAARAKHVIELAHAEGQIPILVGGTGMYMKVLLEGIAPIPEIDPEIREVVRALPTESAYAALQIADPVRAAELAPGDSQRIARALEVVRSTGVTLGDWQQAKAGGIGEEITLAPLVMLPDREWLYERCDTRFEQMLKQGAVAEVEALLARDLSPELPVMRAIGVPEIAAFLNGELSEDEMIAAGQQATRNYAKRQFTWFRRQTSEDWPRTESQNYDSDMIFGNLLRN